MRVLGKGGVALAIAIGCVCFLTSCENTKSENLRTAGSAVSSSSIVEVKEPETIELKVKQMDYNVTETKLEVPGYSDYLYVKNNSEIVADDLESWYTDLCGNSFKLDDKKWKKYMSPIDIMRKNEKKDLFVSDVTQCDNGDYVFIGEKDYIVRLTEDGEVTCKVSAEQLLSKPRFLVSMAYLGDGKAIVQSQDTDFDSCIYEEQDTSIVHLDLIDMKAGKVIRSYPDEWQLCGAIDENYFFVEKEKKIMKVEVDSGEIVKEYTTEAIWSESKSVEIVNEEAVDFPKFAITWCTYNGKLYAKHVGGVFQLDEDELCWKQLISSKDNFTMGPMSTTAFVMLGENRMVLLGYRFDDERPTDCCMYEWE